MADYPGSIVSFTTKTAKQDKVAAAHINSIQDEIEAIQTELGVDVAGDQTNLVTRLAKILADSGAIKQGTSFPGTTETGLLFYKTDEDKLYVRNAADDAWDEVGASFDYDDGTDYDEGEANTERITNSTSFVKLKEFSPLPRSGVVTVVWEHKSEDAQPGRECVSKLYIDGVAVGSDKSTNSTIYTAVSETGVSVSEGEKVQIYAKNNFGSVGYQSYIRNVKIQCTNPTVVREVSGY